MDTIPGPRSSAVVAWTRYGVTASTSAPDCRLEALLVAVVVL